MKTEWQFHYKTHGFYFNKEYKFKGKLTPDNEEHRIEEFTFHLRIEINRATEIATDCEQSGKLFITMPFNYDDAKKYIKLVIFNISQQISFQHGNFEILGGLITGESIPETEEEKIILGDKTCFAEVNIEEVSKTTVFNPENIKNGSYNVALLSQFNHANKMDHPIERYNAFFKILEDKYSLNIPREKIAESLKNEELYTYYKEVFNEYEKTDKDDFNKFVYEIVDIRHRCSHLKKGHEFGYLPNDEELVTRVNPMSDKLMFLTKYILENS